jgi:uncharacterized membrane protein
MQRLLKLAAAGGFIASAGILAFYAFVIYITYPGGYSGLDTIEAVITWISVGLIVALAIGVNIVYARILFAMSRFPRGFPISGRFPRE